jgi:hypothetical protein
VPSAELGLASSTATVRRRARAVSFDLVRALPAWVWLAALVVCSVGIRYAFARRIAAPWIMVDELVYSELAKSFAESGEFHIRGEPAGNYGFLYPLLISPAYLLFDAVPAAHAAAKAINSLLMSLTAVPTYLLARRVITPTSSLLAALLAVAVPSTLYAGTLMTENAFYPLFVAAGLALVLVLERPSPVRQAALLAVCLLAFLARAQAAALLPAILTAPLLLVWIGRRPWRSLSAYWVLFGAIATALVAAVVVQLARGQSLLTLLGAYETTGHQSYRPADVLRWLVYHLAELDLYLGVLPFAAFLVLLVIARGLPLAAQAFVCATVSVVFWLALEVAAFASLPTVEIVKERNLFYVAPFFFIGLLLWLERGLPRPRAAAVVAVAAGALPGVLPFHELIGLWNTSDAFTLLPWWWLQDNLISLAEVPAIVVAFSATLAALFLVTPARYALALPAVVLAYFAMTLPAVENARHGIRMASLGALFEGITTGEPDWVDRTVGDAEVAYVWSGNEKPFALWENEFFNRSIGPVYNVGPPLPGGLPATALVADRRSGVLEQPNGRAVRPRFALAHMSLPLAGEVVRRDRLKGIALLRAETPLRFTAEVLGLYADTWSGPTVAYTRYRCRGGLLVARIETDPRLFETAQRVVASVGGRPVARARVTPARPRSSLRVPLRTGRFGQCRVRFVIAPTAVPAFVQPASDDVRALGVHFRSFEYRAPAR